MLEIEVAYSLDEMLQNLLHLFQECASSHFLQYEKWLKQRGNEC